MVIDGNDLDTCEQAGHGGLLAAAPAPDLGNDTAIGDRGAPAFALACDQGCHVLAAALGGDERTRVKDQHLRHAGMAVADDLTTADHDRPWLRGAVSGLHVLVADLAVLCLKGGYEIVDAAQPAVMLHLQAKRVVHPSADRLGLARRNRGLACRDQVSVDGYGQSALRSHTNTAHEYDSHGISWAERSRTPPADATAPSRRGDELTIFADTDI